MRITVKSAQIVERRIKRQRDGKEFTFREQSGLVSMGDEIRAVAVGLEADQASYPPGVYELQDGSFFVDRNGRLQLGRLSLKPVSVLPSAVESARRSA